MRGLNISKNVTFAGRVSSEQMPQLYCSNDIFIMSSAHEGMSNAMLEAMASGLPIITTRCEGVEELIADNGIVVEKADAWSLAGAVKTVIDDRKLYEQMWVSAMRRREEFGWAGPAKKYLELYEAVSCKKTVLAEHSERFTV